MAQAHTESKFPRVVDLAYRANHDSVTGLANRDHLIEAIDAAVLRRADQHEPFAVLFCDVDRFKLINDTLGHDFGDGVLRIVGARLLEACATATLVGRLGGDEFAVVITGSAADAVAEIADEVVKVVRRPLTLNGRTLPVSISVGYAVGRDDHLKATDVLRDADVALYDAKEQGRDRSQAFSVEHAERVRDRAEIERDLRGAVDRGEMDLHYQPICDVRSGAVVGVEALMRWNHPTRGLLPPAHFTSVAEETGLISSLDRFAFSEACRTFAEWQLRDERAPRMLSVNMSAGDFSDPGMVDVIKGTLEEAGITPSAVCIEITETAMLTSTGTVTRSLYELRSLGCYLCLDDFGTGYSSLAAVRSLPVEVVKIDRSFVDGVATNRMDEAVVSSVMSLAHTLGVHVIAEGVERAEQARVLFDLGCHTMQGYLFGRPRTRQQVASAWLGGEEQRAGVLRRPRVVRQHAEPLFIDEFMNQLGIPLGGVE